MRWKLDKVVCLWRYDGNLSNRWELVGHQATDEDGQPMPSQEELSVFDWLNETVDRGEVRPIMGRAVTGWRFHPGTFLIGFNPPEYCPWLGWQFYDNILHDRKWMYWIEGGYHMAEETAQVAAKLLKGE